VRLSLESWIFVGAFVVDIAGAMPSHRIGLMCSVLPGSKNRAKGQWVVREPGRPWLPPCGTVRMWGPDNEPQARGLVSWTGGSETTGTPQGIAKRRQRSAARGAQGVAQRHSTAETGELASEDPGEGRALPTGGIGGGHQGKHIEASLPVTVTSPDSVRGVRPALRGVTAALPTRSWTNRMPQLGTSGSAGAPGREPWRDPA
jgi:hypothetical protein